MRGKALAPLAMVCALPALSACNRVLGPTKVDQNWHVVESAHFSLYARPGSFAEQNAGALGQVLDDQFEHTQQVLAVGYGGRISAFLYTDAGDAKLMSEHSGTAYPDTAAFSATATPPLDANLYALVAHEANHVIQVNTLGRAGTYFMNEGLASATISERFHPLGPHFYYQWTRAHHSQLVALATLVDDGNWPHNEQNVAYSEAASFEAWLLETQGPEKLRQLYYARSAEFVARFAVIYGRSLAEAEQAWLAFCDGPGSSHSEN